MPTPRDYFDNPREADLADRVWQLSASLPGKWQLQWSHEIFNNAAWPWMNKRIIWARDWITTQREADGKGGVEALNRQLSTSFTAEEIADVEHFYVAALLGTIGGPAGGVMLNAVGDGIWEMLVGPVRIAWSCTLKYGARTGAKATAKSIKDNWAQLTGPDWAGTRFGSFYTFEELAEVMRSAK
ncbi:MAG: hypothetical protein ABSG56_22955 [Bryobacteraceae bacterium]|jgi:hypothetical protein